jgi:hypothetical protein
MQLISGALALTSSSSRRSQFRLSLQLGRHGFSKEDREAEEEQPLKSPKITTTLKDFLNEPKYACRRFKAMMLGP